MNTTHYSELLNLAVAELVTVVKNKGQQSLLSGRGGVLMPDKKQINSLADFELITWLIIRGGQALPDCQAKPDLQRYTLNLLQHNQHAVIGVQ